MTRIKLEYPPGSPTTTIELTWGLEMNSPTWKVDRGTPSKRAFDGTLYVYEKGISQHKIPLKIDLLTEAERDSLIAFVLNIVEGSYRVFRYTDQHGDEHDVRFLNEEFDFGDGTFPYSVPVTLLKE